MNSDALPQHVRTPLHNCDKYCVYFYVYVYVHVYFYAFAYTYVYAQIYCKSTPIRPTDTE